MSSTPALRRQRQAAKTKALTENSWHDPQVLINLSQSSGFQVTRPLDSPSHQAEKQSLFLEGKTPEPEFCDFNLGSFKALE